MADTKEIDSLVRLLRDKRSELLALGEEIESSAAQTAVLFIDLSNSTDLKNEVAPQEWLGYVYEFLQSVTEHAELAGGTVVKRIGDELMVTVGTVAQSEVFIDALISEPKLQRYQYKVAADYGAAYHFKFAKHLELDPYGQVIDRCARIAKLANAGVILVSEPYFKEIKNLTVKYTKAGDFSLKGLREPVQVYLRPLASESPEKYIEPLLRNLNGKDVERIGYRTISRKYEANYFRQSPNGEARPFLLRELLNVPLLPLSPQQFQSTLNVPNSLEIAPQYYGYLVEWTGVFVSYKRSSDEIEVRVKICDKGGMNDEASLTLVPDMLEIVKLLNPGDKLCFRGIITRIYIVVWLNYVEIISIEKQR